MLTKFTFYMNYFILQILLNSNIDEQNKKFELETIQALPSSTNVTINLFHGRKQGKHVSIMLNMSCSINLEKGQTWYNMIYVTSNLPKEDIQFPLMYNFSVMGIGKITTNGEIRLMPYSTMYNAGTPIVTNFSYFIE